LHEIKCINNWYEKNGKYSVKSAYHYCIEDTLDLSHLEAQGNWSLIWRIKAPPKIKNFIWRLCQNCIPTRTRLLEKGVNCSGDCVLCDADIEDNMHIFMSCNINKQVWYKTGLWNTIRQSVATNNNLEHVAIS
jgi:hypothetical protein